MQKYKKIFLVLLSFLLFKCQYEAKRNNPFDPGSSGALYYSILTGGLQTTTVTGASASSFPQITNTIVSIINTSADMYGLTFDGTNLWYVTRSGTVFKYTYQKISTTGIAVSALDPLDCGLDIAFRSNELYCGGSGEIQKLNPTTGALLYKTTTSVDCWGFESDGTDLWCNNGYSNKITKISPSNGSIILTIQSPEGNNTTDINGGGIVFKGSVFFASWTSGKIFRANALTGEITGYMNNPCSYITYFASDGNYLYAACAQSYRKIYKLSIP